MYVTIMLILRPLAYDLLSLIVIRSFDASYFSRNCSLTSNYWCKVLYNIIFWYFNVLSLIDDILIFIPGIGYLPSLFFAWSVLPGVINIICLFKQPAFVMWNLSFVCFSISVVSDLIFISFLLFSLDLICYSLLNFFYMNS